MARPERRITIQDNTFPNSTRAYDGSGGLTQQPILCRNRLSGASAAPTNCTLRSIPPYIGTWSIGMRDDVPADGVPQPASSARSIAVARVRMPLL